MNHSGRRDAWQGPGLTMAFQPIINFATREVFGYEALVRGTQGETAGDVLSHVTPRNQVVFERICHSTAIEAANRLGLQPHHFLSINFLPSSLQWTDDGIAGSLELAASCGIDPGQIVLEVTESEPVEDPARMTGLFADYRQRGVKTAIDDFGVGYAGLSLLADFQPDFIKIAMPLVRSIDESPARAAITRAILQAARDLSIEVIAEGVETQREVGALRVLGVNLFQGFLFARPVCECLTPRERIRFSEPEPGALPLQRSVGTAGAPLAPVSH